jgi:hypothetical protein
VFFQQLPPEKSISIAWVDVQFFSEWDAQFEMQRGFQGGHLSEM